MKHFSADLTATQIAHLNINTTNKILHLLRQRMFELSQLQSAPLVGQIEVDERYFGTRRVRGKRDRGASGKTIVFCLLKRGDKVHTQLIKKCERTTLHVIMKERISPESIINSDDWSGYTGLVDFDYKKQCSVHHGTNEFARGNSHINGIESFWSYAKTRRSKFRGMNKNRLELHLKECEFRFNTRGQNLYKILLHICRKKPLNWLRSLFNSSMNLISIDLSITLISIDLSIT